MMQLTKRWKKARRLFKTLDSDGSGIIAVNHFRKILEQCDVSLSSEHVYHLLEVLDPQLSGTFRIYQLQNLPSCHFGPIINNDQAI